MSPEQAAGEKPLPDADIYSLGATLYRLATGHAPFEGSNLPEVLKKIAANDFPAPQVSKDLDAIILKAMAPPGKRYRSAGEMADDLDRFARSEPVEAVPPSRFVWMLKRHWPSLAVIALLALVGAFLVFRMFQARSEAVTFLEDADLFIRHGRFQEAEKQVDRALEMEGLTPRVMERRSRIMALKVAAERQRVETANLKLASARSILEQAKLNLYKKGSTFSQAFFSDLDKAMLELRESLALSESAEAHYLMGSILSLQGRYDEALKEFDSSNDSRSPLAKARTYIDMAIEALFEGREADSTLLLDSARQILAENGEASELAQAWKLLAQGDNEGAIEYSRERVRSDEEFQVVIGVAQARLKQPREAVRSFTAAIDRRPNYYQAFFYRGYAVKQAGNADYALREYDQAIAIYPHYVRALLARAEIYAERNERDKAVQDWKLVLKLRPEMKALEARINGR
jgi:tetratricopeptide (TPR) repeat protein